MACKPGSVPVGLVTVIHLGRLLPAASSDLPGRKCAGPRTPRPKARTNASLFGLAPDGVCPAQPVTRLAVRSYRTVSPLPATWLAVCFLWHFPWGHPRRALPGILIPWSPDFPPSRNPWGLATATVRPSDSGGILGGSSAPGQGLGGKPLPGCGAGMPAQCVEGAVKAAYRRRMKGTRNCTATLANTWKAAWNQRLRAHICNAAI